MFKRSRRGADFAAEIRSHLELEADQLRGEGWSEDEAYRKARTAFGSVAAAQERFNLRHRFSWLDTLLRDLAFALRQTARSRGFSIVVIMTLALGIGAATSIFSVADAVLLRPLPYPKPQQILRVWEQTPSGYRSNFAESNFEDFAAENRSFATLAAYSTDLATVLGGSVPIRGFVASVSKSFFPTFQVQPLHGRLFTPEERTLHGVNAVVVSFGFWQRSLGSARALSGIRLDLDGSLYSVVGVMPPAFDVPAGALAWTPRELDQPSPSRTAHNWRVIGRMRDGVTKQQAQQDLGAIARRLRSHYGDQVDLNDAAVVTLSDSIVGNVRTALRILIGAVALLLLVACTNVAGLLVARTSARTKELAIRTALGASRVRLIQQFLVEAFVVCAAAGGCGILIAAAFVRILPSILPETLPRKETISVNLVVLGFALSITVLVAVTLGLIAAWESSRAGIEDAWNAGLRTHSNSGATHRLRRVLVISEIAVTLVILVGAGLLGRSFLQLIHTSPGFRLDHVTTLEFSLRAPPHKIDRATLIRQTQLLDEMMSRLQAMPGASSVGIAGDIPAAAGDNLADGTFLILNGQPPPADFDEFGRMALNKGLTGHALYAVASQGYFKTLGVPLLGGRMFGEQDSLDAPHVAVISKALAQQQWPGQDPTGKQIEFGNMDGDLRPLTIIGVVGDVRVRGLDAPADAVIYVNYRQRGVESPTLLIRAASSDEAVGSQAQTIVRGLLPGVPVKISTLEAALGGWLAERRFLLLLVGFFAASSLLLATVGLYGVVAFFVAQHTHEIGVRVAMGAQRRDILYLVLGEAARMSVTGIATGIAASLALTRLLASLIFGISATDPATFMAVALLLILVALVASWRPAHRAMELDPIRALRQD